MLYPDYTDTEIVTAAIFHRKYGGEPPIMSVEELRDELIITHLVPQWMLIAATVAQMSASVRSQLAHIDRRALADEFANDVPMFGGVAFATREKTTTGWQGKVKDKE